MAKSGDGPKQRLSQTDVPGHSLEQALRIPQAIAQNYASSPTKPLHVANGVGMAPNSSHFRQLCGAAIAYGLTDGGHNAASISITALGKKITRPLEVGEDREALREAFLKPRVIGEFMIKYDGSPFPPPDIARNILTSMGVPEAKAPEIFEMIVDGAKTYGLVQEIKGKLYGDLSAKPNSGGPEVEESDVADQDADEDSNNAGSEERSSQRAPASPTAEKRVEENRKVFITHGKDKSFVEPIKKLLAFGEMIPVVSVEKQSTSVPVPEKVLQEMRSCSAAIIHVGDSEAVLRKDGTEAVLINPNVLIEIGVALALYNKRFILLVKEGVQLPSNLQGLFEVRYSGDNLDGDATIRLLEAINEMKNQKPPQS